jgi:hypothetical protein
LDYFGGMMFKKYWGWVQQKRVFPRDLTDYIFVRKQKRVPGFRFQLFGMCRWVNTVNQAGKLRICNLQFAICNFCNFCRFGFACLLVLACTGCSLTPLAPVNLQEGRWKVREGQAVWKRNKDAPEIAGDVLLATREDGSTFVQFTKTPFPMIIAQTTTNRWQIQIPMQNKRYSGPGSPPKRLIWAYLPRLLAGTAPPKGWLWNPLPDNRWRLENSRTGEILEGYLSPSVK